MALSESFLQWEQRVEQQKEEQVKRSIALKMLQGNLSLEQISQFTGLTIAQIQALQTQAE